MKPRKKKRRETGPERFHRIQMQLFDEVAKDFQFQVVETGEFKFKIRAVSETSRANLVRLSRKMEPEGPVNPGYVAVTLLYLATSMFNEEATAPAIDPTADMASVEGITADTFEIELFHKSLRKTVLELASKRQGTAAEAVEILIQGGAAVVAMQETLEEPHLHGDDTVH